MRSSAIHAVAVLLGGGLVLVACASEPAGPPARPAAAATPVPAASPAGSSQHWSVGTWRGEISGMPNPGRTLRITEVRPDGTATGNWSGEQVPVTVRGETVIVDTQAGNRVELRRAAPDRLEGTFFSVRSRAGAVRPVAMTRS